LECVDDPFNKGLIIRALLLINRIEQKLTDKNAEVEFKRFDLISVILNIKN